MIFLLLGKSGSGKDTIRKEIMKRIGNKISFCVPYTNREIRPNEQDGRDYFFIKEKKDIKNDDLIVSEKCVDTVRGRQLYIQTVPKNYKEKNYLVISGISEIIDEFYNKVGEKYVCPIGIDVNDRDLLIRSIYRESKNSNPKYKEVCRRFISDKEDFEKIEHQYEHFKNDDYELCGEYIADYILQIIQKSNEYF